MTTGFELAALGILFMGLTVLIYVLVWLHGIPHQIAVKNNHPHASAIHVACWLSVFTLHALWPLVYLWAIMPSKRLAVDVSHVSDEALVQRIAALERQMSAMNREGNATND